jgi:uncharacterized protein YwgA
MNLIPQNLLLLAIEAFDGSVEGRTLLQKRIYFIEQILRHRHNQKVNLGYDALHYGPYSGVIAEATSSLVNIGVLEESCLDYGMYNRAGFEVKSYRFSLTEAGRRAAKALKACYASEAKLVEKAAVEFLSAGGTLDYQDLSFAAKAHFVQSHAHQPLTLEAMQQEAKRLYRWDVSPSQIERGFNFLKKAGLVPAPKTVAKPLRSK